MRGRTRLALVASLAMVALMTTHVFLAGGCGQSGSRGGSRGGVNPTWDSPGSPDPSQWFADSYSRHVPGSAKRAVPNTMSASDLRDLELRQEAWALSERMAASGMGVPVEEELWIIQQPDDWGVVEDDEQPGTGALITSSVEEGETVPVPLEHTDVRAEIGGMLASTVVTQQFHNPYDSLIEAVYVFPLPQNAAVNEFVMEIGERRIRGVIREREEAERLYVEARAAGRRSTLLTQERPNVFTQKVANIEPGRRIDVEITYFHSLPYREGGFEYTFPMVVGPRFNPPHTSDGMGAVGRGGHRVSGQSTEVHYLSPGERSGHDVSVNVTIDAGVEIGAIRSKHHAVEVRRDSERRAMVRLAEESTIANRDFVLRYEVGGDTTRSGVIVRADPETGEGFFTMLIVPPEELKSLPRRPLELVFVIDASGSMDGSPLRLVKRSVDRGLSLLEPEDRFQIVRFSDDATPLGAELVDATPSNVRKAKRYVRSISAGGGTMMREGMRAALSFPQDPRRTRFVCFLTDGFIGNEVEVLGEMRANLRGSRVFSFGIGSSPNRYLMERMAKLGNGAVAYVSLDDDGPQVMDRFFEVAGRPALEDVRIDWRGLEATDVFPERVVDLYAGRAVQLVGRCEPGDLPHAVRLVGTVDGERRTIEAPVVQPGSLEGTDERLARGMRSVWARAQIAELIDEATYEPVADLQGRVETIALAHGLLSPFTAFLAVDATTVVSGGEGTTVHQAVPVPEGVRYETTVPSGRK